MDAATQHNAMAAALRDAQSQQIQQAILEKLDQILARLDALETKKAK